MKPATNDNMTCLLLGHNYYKIADTHQSNDKVICKNCGVISKIDTKGNFISIPSIDENFVTALRKLFLLKRSMYPSIKQG